MCQSLPRSKLGGGGPMYGKSVKFVGVPASPGASSQDLHINTVPDNNQSDKNRGNSKINT